MVLQTHSFWWNNSPPDFYLNPQLPTNADVVIIGAGFAGVSTAYWLLRFLKKTKKTLRIVLVEEGPHAAFKATGRMNGSIYLGSNKTANSLLEQLDDTAEGLYAYSALNNSTLKEVIDQGSLEVAAEFNGGLRMGSTAKELVELDKSAALMKRWGYFPVTFNQNETQHVALSPITRGSLFVPNEGMFDPFAFTNTLARILRRHGVWIVYGSRVKTTDTDPAHGPQVILENGHVIAASKVVHCTSNTIPILEQCRKLKSSIIYRREHTIKTEPLSADLDASPLPIMPIEMNSGMDSFRPYSRSIIATGGKTGLKKDPELNGKNDSSFNQKILDNLVTCMVESFPVATHMELSNRWTYIETESKDGLPFMGELPQTNGHFVNIAHGRNKFGLAFLGAKNIAEKVLNVKSTTKGFEIFDPARVT